MAEKKGQHGGRRPGAGNPPGTKSKTSTGRGRKAVVDPSAWRKQVVASRIKFDDEQKKVYLDELAENGGKGAAAQAAGVSYQTMAKHREKDEAFADAEQEAITRYRQKIRREVKRRGEEGWEEPIFFKGMRAIEPVLDGNGQPVYVEIEDPETGEKKRVPKMRYATVRKFSDQLLILEAKRVDPAYREKSSVDVTSQGGRTGVLVLPEQTTPETSPLPVEDVEDDDK